VFGEDFWPVVYKTIEHKIFQTSIYLLLFSGIFLAATAFPASARSAEQSRVSGTYEVVQRVETGAKAHIRVKLHLINHEPQTLHIQRLAFHDFASAAKGGSQSCSIVIAAQASLDTTQNFTIRREEYEMWKRGARPRLILELRNANGPSATEVVHLDRIADGPVGNDRIARGRQN
jgi:hypothetical protein